MTNKPNKICLSKTYTCNGCPVVLYNTSVPGTDHPVHGYFTNAEGKTLMCAWTSTGETPLTTKWNLIEVKETIKIPCVLHYFSDGMHTLQGISPHLLDTDADNKLVARVTHTFEFEVGEGMSDAD